MAGQLNQAANSNMEPLEDLLDESQAQLSFCDKLLPHYLNSCKFDTALLETLTPLTAIIAAEILQNPQCLWDKNHQLQQLLSLIQYHCIGWQADAGKAAERFADQLHKTLLELHTQWRNGHDTADYQVLTLFFDKHEQRINKLEQRLKDTEGGALKARRSQELGVRLLNDKMHNKQLPAPMSHFLQNSWKDSLILLLINSDDMSREYQRLSKLTETFIWTFQRFDPEDKETQQRIYRFIPTLQEEFHSSTISLKHEADQLAGVLSDIENEHLKILKGEALEYQAFTLFENNSPLNNSKTQISNTLLKQVNLLKQGQWLLETSNAKTQQPQRIKLLLKLNDSQQLLFSNHNGIKACQYSFEEFAYKLSTKAFKLLPSHCRLGEQSSQFIANLLNIQQQQQEKNAQRGLAQQQKQEAIQQQRLLDRQKALKEAQLIEERNKQKTLELQTQQQKEQELNALAEQNRLEQHENLSEESYQAAKEKLERFNIGGAIHFNNDDKTLSRCKLAAKTQQAEKFIFVNKNGLKDRELSKQEFIKQLASGHAKIINNGSEFEDALSKVVSGLRNKQ